MSSPKRIDDLWKKRHCTLNISSIIESTGAYAATNDTSKALALRGWNAFLFFASTQFPLEKKKKVVFDMRKKHSLLSIIGFELHFADERWQTQNASMHTSTHTRSETNSLKSFSFCQKYKLVHAEYSTKMSSICARCDKNVIVLMKHANHSWLQRIGGF